MRWAPAVTVSLVMSFSMASLPRRGWIGLFSRPARTGRLSSTYTFALASLPSSDCRTEAIQRRVALTRFGDHLDEAAVDGLAPGGQKLSTGPAQALGQAVGDPECAVRPVLSLKKGDQRTQVRISHHPAHGFCRQPRTGRAEAI